MLADAGAADAAAIRNREQRTVPIAGDEVARGGEIVVERLGQWHAGMRAAIDIADDAIALPHDEAVEAAGAHLEDEVARLAVGDVGQRASATPAGWWRGVRSRVRVGLAAGVGGLRQVRGARGGGDHARVGRGVYAEPLGRIERGDRDAIGERGVSP